MGNSDNLHAVALGSDTTAINACIAIANSIRKTNTDSAFYWIASAKIRSLDGIAKNRYSSKQRLFFQKTMIKSLIEEINIFVIANKFDSAYIKTTNAIIYVDEVIKELNNNNPKWLLKFKIDHWSAQASNAIDLSMYNEAIIWLKKVNQYDSINSDLKNQIVNYTNLGNAYMRTSNYSVALDNYFKALNISDSLILFSKNESEIQKAKESILINYNNIGNFHSLQNNFILAKNISNKALILNKK